MKSLSMLLLKQIHWQTIHFDFNFNIQNKLTQKPVQIMFSYSVAEDLFLCKHFKILIRINRISCIRMSYHFANETMMFEN